MRRDQPALWPNNPLIFDPAVHFGDREADLAMARLRGGDVPGFHVTYQETWPLIDRLLGEVGDHPAVIRAGLFFPPGNHGLAQALAPVARPLIEDSIPSLDLPSDRVVCC